MNVDSDAAFNFLLHCRKIETMSKFSGAVHFVSGSEVVNCNSVVVDRYIVSFDMADRCCFWEMVLCLFGLLDALLGVSSYAVSTLSTDGLSSPKVCCGGCELTRL